MQTILKVYPAHTPKNITAIERTITSRNSISSTPIAPSTSQHTEIVFIDSTVEDYQQLAASVKPEIITNILAPNYDGIEQITEVLSRYKDVKSIHIVAHGAPGYLQLGATALSLANLARSHKWTKALADDAEILLYGCNVADTEAGADFVRRLSQVTGATIAASTTPIGNAALGGDWELNFTTATIETELAFPLSVRQAYPSVLATFTVTNTNDSGAGSLRQAIIDANLNDGNDTIVFDAELAGQTITLTGEELVIVTFDNVTPGDLTIDAAAAPGVTISGNNNSRVFNVVAAAETTVTLANLTIVDGIATEPGGGIANNGEGTLEITNSTISGNTAENGGGGIAHNSGTLTITDSTVSGNSSTGNGGGLVNNSPGTLNVINSTISDNQATDGINDGNPILGQGGGIANNVGTLTIVKSTISGNTATGGGGVADFGQQTTIVNSTITNNQAALTDEGNGGGGGVLSFAEMAGGQTFIQNTIIAGNSDTGSNANGRQPQPDVRGDTLTSLGGNIIGTDSEGIFTETNDLDLAEADIPVTDIIEEALADNGDATQTHALILDPTINRAIDGGTPVNFTGDRAFINDLVAVDSQGNPLLGSPDVGAVQAPIDAVNDAPTLTVPTTTLEVDEDTELPITGIVVEDIDALDQDITVTLSVTNGTLSVDSGVTDGLVADDITDNDSDSVTLVGTVAEINATLAATDGLIYQGNADFEGTDTLSVEANDGGNTGTEGAKTDSENLTIIVNAIDDQDDGDDDDIDNGGGGDDTDDGDDNLDETPGLSLDDANIFTVTGAAGEEVTIEFAISDRDVSLVNEIGVIVFDDLSDLEPSNFSELTRDQGQVIFSVLPDALGSDSPSRQLSFEVGQRLVFYQVLDSSTDAVLAGQTPISDVVFASSAANDGTDFLEVSQLDDGDFQLAWTEQSGSDFDDIIFTAQVTTESQVIGTAIQGQEQGELIDLTDIGGLVEASFVVSSEAAFDNFVGLYTVDDTTGRIGDLMPGDEGYAVAAMEQTVLESDLQSSRSASGSVQIDGGTILAPYIIANGNREAFLEDNSENQEPESQDEPTPVAYFTYLGANPDGVDHIRLLGDNLFGFEDIYGGGDGDFNDVVFAIDITPA